MLTFCPIYNPTCWVCPSRQDEIPVISHLRPEDMWPPPSCIPYAVPYFSVEAAFTHTAVRQTIAAQQPASVPADQFMNSLLNTSPLFHYSNPHPPLTPGCTAPGPLVPRGYIAIKVVSCAHDTSACTCTCTCGRGFCFGARLSCKMWSDN